MTQREGKILFGGYEANKGLKKALSMDEKDVFLEVEKSKLKGRGGAGFPTYLKWKFSVTGEVGDLLGKNRYVVCNADEGEPGTFKDRVLLLENFELLVEGMVIAGYAIHAHNGIIYLRYEYSYMLEEINKKLDNLRSNNKLGKNINGKDFDFDIEIDVGAGAYVCGEETSLIESIEGNRGEPRNRPPYPVNVGFMGMPTIVNNVETLCCIPHILAKGGDWFAKIGTENSTGTKLLSISGDCEKPGVYEVPFGITVKEVLKMVKASYTKAVQVGGASGRCLIEKEYDRKICFEDLSTGGSVMIFNKARDMRSVLKNFMEFFTDESCGQCTPCRQGNMCLLDAINRFEGSSCKECNEKYLNELLELCETMRISSKCGLGQSSSNAFVDIATKFKDELLG